MSDARRIGKYFVAQALGSAGFFVMASYNHEPDYWRKLAWFPSKDRAESYAEIENDMNDGDLEPREEELQEKPSLPEPPSAVKLENFRPELAVGERPAPIVLPPPSPPPAPPPPPQRVTVTEEVVERREYRSIARDEDPTAKVWLTWAQGAVLKALAHYLPEGRGKVTLKDLAVFAGVPQGSVSAHLDSLEKKGCVRREGEMGEPIYAVLRQPTGDALTIEEDDPPPRPPTPPAAMRQVARRLDGPAADLAAPSRERLMGSR